MSCCCRRAADSYAGVAPLWQTCNPQHMDGMDVAVASKPSAQWHVMTWHAHACACAHACAGTRAHTPTHMRARTHAHTLSYLCSSRRRRQDSRDACRADQRIGGDRKVAVLDDDARQYQMVRLCLRGFGTHMHSSDTVQGAWVVRRCITEGHSGSLMSYIAARTELKCDRHAACQLHACNPLPMHAPHDICTPHGFKKSNRAWERP
jgi:hypothetical protein